MKKQEIWRPRVHFAPEKGWMNDPNGLIYFQGKYHLFYQYNPYHCKWDSMHWGHATSSDLLHWKEEEIALYPDAEYDKDQEGGCFSGSVMVKDEKLYVLYTGCIKREGKAIQRQCLAVSEDGIHFKKVCQNPVIENPPAGGGADFRDPKVVWAKGRYRLLCGGTDGDPDQSGSRGRIYLYSSEDLYRWEYQGILYEAQEGEGTMFECPDLFPVGDQWVVGISPIRRSDCQQNVFMLGEIDFDACRFDVKRKGVFDAGPYYYAAQTYAGRDGAPLSVAWLGGWPWMPWALGLAPTDAEGYRGVMSIPRTFSLDKEGNLRAAFAPDLTKAAAEILKAEQLPLREQEHKIFEQLKETDRTVFLRFCADMAKWEKKQLQMDLWEGEKEKICFRIDYEKGRFEADYSKADPDSRMEKEGFAFAAEGEKLVVEMVLDRSVGTILLQHGKSAYTFTFYPREGKYGLCFEAPFSEAVLESVEIKIIQ